MSHSPAASSPLPAVGDASAQKAQNSRAAGAGGVRPEIQALRALAVGIVVLYHLWPNSLTGGFVGVDVFFAISGFLITAHLLREAVGTGRISLPKFWAKRARRLLPASLVVLVVSAIAIIVWVPQAFWNQFLGEIAASGLYIQNWNLAASAIDYLAADNVPSPVQHYWSLSAEEQFYIIWPILMLVALWFARKRSARTRTIAIGVVLGIVVAVSLVISIWLTNTDPAWAYFITPTRAWEFGAGGLLALVAGGVSKAPSAVRAIVSWLGLAAILATAVLYSDATPFPGYQAALPVLGTLAVIWAGNPDRAWAPSRLASIRPVQWLGDVSYSVYLWHFPLIVILPLALGADLGLAQKLVIVVATLLLAWLSKTFIEDPVRQGRWLATHKPRWTFAITAAAMVIVVGSSSGVVAVVNEQAREYQAAADTVLATAPECLGLSVASGGVPVECGQYDLGTGVVPAQSAFSNERPEIYSDECRSNNGETEAKDCVFGDKTSDTVVVLVGDSHAAQWFPTLKALAEKDKFALHVLFKSGCPFVDTSLIEKGRFSSGCAGWNKNALETITAMPSVDLVATAATAGYPIRTDKDKTDRIAAYTSRLESVTALDTPVLVFQDTPKMGEKAIECVASSSLDDVRDCGRSRADAFQKTDLLATAAAKVDGVTVVSVNDQLCSADWCPAVIGNVIVYRDTSSHMTTSFSQSLAPIVESQVGALIRGSAATPVAGK